MTASKGVLGYGEMHARLVSQRFLGVYANDSAVKAIALGDRPDNCVAFSEASGFWRFDKDSAASASDFVLVPETGDGRWLATSSTPTTHAARHENTGADEINVGGLSGQLADEQDPLDHAIDHEPGGGDAMAVDAVAGTGSLRTLGTGAQQATAGNDARLSDSRAPNGSAGGQLGGTYPNPDVRGLRTTTGPTELTVAAVADGEYLRRTGTDVVGDSPAPAVTRIDHNAHPYTMLVTDGTLMVNTTGGPCTVLLLAGVSRKVHKIVNVGSGGNDVTVTPDGAESLYGAAASFALHDGEMIDPTYDTTEGWY